MVPLVPLRRRIWAWSLTVAVGAGPWAGLHAQSPGAGLGGLPYQDPKPLQELLALDDAGLQRRLDSEWSAMRQVLDGFVPPGAEITAVPRVFIGARDECLRSHLAPSCRIYLGTLVEMNKEKQQQGSLLANPLGPTRDVSE
jgi:hypothetical protein